MTSVIRQEAVAFSEEEAFAWLAANGDALRADAEVVADECGFKSPFKVDGPNVERYPRFGHGYSLKIQEIEGKRRMATLRYTSNGERSFWQMDGMITG